jgi:hypothetical protein
MFGRIRATIFSSAGDRYRNATSRYRVQTWGSPPGHVEKLETRQTSDYLIGESGAFPHGQNSVEIRKRGDYLVGGNKRPMEKDQLGPLPQNRPVDALFGDALPVIEHGDSRDQPGCDVLINIVRVHFYPYETENEMSR